MWLKCTKNQRSSFISFYLHLVDWAPSYIKLGHHTSQWIWTFLPSRGLTQWGQGFDHCSDRNNQWQWLAQSWVHIWRVNDSVNIRARWVNAEHFPVGSAGLPVGLPAPCFRVPFPSAHCSVFLSRLLVVLCPQPPIKASQLPLQSKRSGRAPLVWWGESHDLPKNLWLLPHSSYFVSNLLFIFFSSSPPAPHTHLKKFVVKLI